MEHEVYIDTEVEMPSAVEEQIRRAVMAALEGEKVDVHVFCPERVAPFSQMVQGELSRIITDNGLTANAVQVQQMTRPLTISGVFPRIFEGENSINVKI